MHHAASIALDVEAAIRNVCSELVLTPEDAIRFIVREWMEKNTYLPVHDLDEDGGGRREWLTGVMLHRNSATFTTKWSPPLPIEFFRHSPETRAGM